MRGDGSLFKIGPVWYVNATINGVRIRKTTGTRDRKEAKAFLDRLMTKPGPTIANRTMREAFDELQEDFELREIKSLSRALSRLKHIRSVIGHKLLSKLDDGDLIDFVRRRRLDGYANESIRHDLQFIGQALKIAVKRKWLAECPTIPAIAPGRPRTGFVTQEKFDEIMTYLPADVRDFAAFGFVTGWRKGEIQALTWAMVHDTFIHIPDSKSGDGRVVPIAGPIREIIDRRRAAAEGDYVFHRDGNQTKDFKKAWRTAVKKAGIPTLIFHDLRRSAARDMRRANVPDSVAMKITGHKTRAMYDRYDIVNEADMADAIVRTAALRSVQVVTNGTTANPS